PLTSLSMPPAGIYVAGRTSSRNFPVSSQALQPPSAALTCRTLPFECNDAFVVKLDSRGALVFATYYGGSNEDRAVAVGTDPSGAVYVAVGHVVARFSHRARHATRITILPGRPELWMREWVPDAS